MKRIANNANNSARHDATFARACERLAAAALPAVLLSSSIALAAGGEEAHGGDHAIHINWFGIGEQYKESPALGFLIITFLIFAGLVIYFARKPMNEHLASRADEIKRTIEEAAKAKEAAEARARAAEARLAKLEQEISTMRADIENQGKAEIARLEQAGKTAAERIAKDAEDTIAAETLRAQNTLQQEAVRLALNLAEQRLTQAVSTADDDALRQNFLRDLGAA